MTDFDLTQVPPPDPPPVAPPAPAAPPRRPLTTALLLPMLLSLVTAAATAAFVTQRLQPPPLPTPSVRIAVIDVARLANAVRSTGQDPWTTGFADRLNRAITQLQQSDPTRILLVKEAVIGNGVEDLTDSFLPLAAPAAPQPAPSGLSELPAGRMPTTK